MWALCVTPLNQTPIFEWYMARFRVKNGHQKDTCYDEIELCAQNIDTILGSIVNMSIGSQAYVTTYEEQEYSLWPLTTFASREALILKLN